MKTNTQKTLNVFLILLCCVPATILFPLLTFPSEASDVYKIFVYVICYTVIALPVTIYCMVTKPPLRQIGLRGRLPVWLQCIIGLLLFIIIIIICPPLFTVVLRIGSGTLLFSFYKVCIFAIVAFSEEFIFRGFLQGNLCKRFGAVQGILISSACFAVFHIPKLLLAGYSLEAILLNCLLVMIASLVYGGFAFFFGGIYTAVFVHAAVNMVLASL